MGDVLTMLEVLKNTIFSFGNFLISSIEIIFAYLAYIMVFIGDMLALIFQYFELVIHLIPDFIKPFF